LAGRPTHGALEDTRKLRAAQVDGHHDVVEGQHVVHTPVADVSGRDRGAHAGIVVQGHVAAPARVAAVVEHRVHDQVAEGAFAGRLRLERNGGPAYDA